jgi:hypothetical protein
MENSRNKQSINFKLYTILSSMMEILYHLLCLIQDMNDSLIQSVHSV